MRRNRAASWLCGSILWAVCVGCGTTPEPEPSPSWDAAAPATGGTPTGGTLADGTAAGSGVNAAAVRPEAQVDKPAPARVPAMKLVAPTPKNLTTTPGAPPAAPTANAPTGESARDELAALLASYESSQLDPAARAALVKPGLEALVARYPGSDEALTARLRLLAFTWWEREAGTMNESAGRIADAILTEYASSRRLAEMTHSSYVFSGEQRSRYFGQLTASPHPEVRAAAEYELARAGLRSKEDSVRAEAKVRLERLQSEYADLPYKYTTYGEIATALQSPHPSEALAIGTTAPEIVGKDHHGREMKLSDYRGKVVVLDFWGDW